MQGEQFSKNIRHVVSQAWNTTCRIFIFCKTAKKKKNISEKNQGIKNGIEVKSPIIGTAYHAPEPGAKKFVEIGKKIKKGDTVCIIEAMKMMNQVKSEFDGKIISINIGDGEPVEFGQELISIEKS